MTKLQANFQEDLIDYIEFKSCQKAIRSSSPAIREEEINIRLARLQDSVSSLVSLISLFEINSKSREFQEQNAYLVRFAKDRIFDLGDQLSDLSDDVHLHFQEPLSDA